MEARDTVMNEKELEEVERAYLAEDFSVNAIRLNRGHTEDLRLRIAQAQAEISFTAGQWKLAKWVLDWLGRQPSLDTPEWIAEALRDEFKAQLGEVKDEQSIK